MVDTSLFGRLKRLFSTDVIIRNVGGNQLKVLDTVNIQATGVVQTNMYPERYQRIYTGGMGTYVGNAPYSNFTIIRPQLYNDYEVMDGDPIIASVLDIVADESTLKNGAGEILSIKSSDENVQRILYNLFYDVLNIEFNLWGWIRSMCKYGDFYLHMHVAEKYGIYQVIPLNVYNVIREEGLDPKNPAYVRFKVEPNASYMSVTTAGGRNDEYFDNYEIANFRLLGDYNFLPYGRSYIEPARKIYKQLCLDGDSKIWTSQNGYKLIKDIEAGEEIFTYNVKTKQFEKSKIVNSLKTGNKDIYKLSTGHRTILLTDEHPVLTENNEYKALKDLSIKDKIVVSNKLGDFNDIIPELFYDDDLVYAEVTPLGQQYLKDKIKIKCLECGKELNTFNSGRHLLTHNMSIGEYKKKYGVNSTQNLTYNKRFMKGDYRIKLSDLKEILTFNGLEFNEDHYNYHYKNQNLQIVSNETLQNNISEFIRFFGFMEGDGWIDYSNNTVCFSLGDRLDKSMKYYELLNRLGFNPSIKQKDLSSAYVSTCNFQLIKIFENLDFRTGTFNKSVPDWVYNLSEKNMTEFLLGFVDADGCRMVNKNKKYQAAGSNKKLIQDLQFISQRLGFRTSNIHESKPKESVIIKGIEYITKEPKPGFAFNFSVDGNDPSSSLIESITKIELLENRDVYDIQVESDNHNFIADGIVVHNCMMEDAMLIHRILRAPQRRVYYVDTGGIPPNEIPAYMEKLKSQTSRTPYVDPKSGEYNLRYNMMNVNEDFYVPTRGDKSGTKIDTLPGLEYNAIEDVIYLRDKMLAAVKVPKAFLGYEADVEGKCIDPLTKIPLLDGRTITVAELIEEHNNGIKNYVYSLDTETNNIVPGEIEWAGMTRLNTQTVKVWLDNGEYIRCTPDHKFLTRDGIYKDAQDLKENEALMPLYLRKSDDKKINGYDEVYNNQFPETNEYYLNTYKPEQKEWKEKYSYKNHKVAKVEWCDDLIDTCDITIKDYHNFGTAAGVIIHNSTLAQQDIRFARTIERIQRIVVSELTKMALVHLYAQGYNDESLTNFELELTTPSIIYEQEKIALMKEKVDLAKNMMDINLFPTDHIYDYLFHMSEDKYDDLRDLMIEDKKRIFRLSQIENEGNDPVLSGESYGTPHDLASLYGKGRNGMGELPSIAYDEKNPVGRPVEKTSVYNTQKRIIGKDPLGKGLDLGPDTPNAPVPKGGSPLALEGTKSVYVQSKKMLNEMKNKLSAFREESLLDESNIKGID